MLYRCPRRVVASLPTTQHGSVPMPWVQWRPVFCFLLYVFLNNKTVHVYYESPPTHHPCFMSSLPLVWLRAVLALRSIHSLSLRIQGQLRFAVSLCTMRATQEPPLLVSILRHWEARPLHNQGAPALSPNMCCLPQSLRATGTKLICSLPLS